MPKRAICRQPRRGGENANAQLEMGHYDATVIIRGTLVERQAEWLQICKDLLV